VMVHGAYTTQRALEARVLYEVEIHQIPVLFGRGLRLCEDSVSRLELEMVRVIDTPEATHIHYASVAEPVDLRRQQLPSNEIDWSIS